ncbi:MAG: hypothetical protein KF819_34715 [Labilithrix sp.]|nr:hypothetical protein [Labilithrix sp.]
MTRALVIASALLLAGCSTNVWIDRAMVGADHPRVDRGLRVGQRTIFAGDLHCHVLPPDSPRHVSRELPETLSLAKSEELDFVVLTPHVSPRFFADDEKRARVLSTQHELKKRIARLQGPSPDLVVIPGFEYTDARWGHVGASFADLEEVLADFSSEEGRDRPERFFQRWVARGGILTINHPVNRPLPEAPFSRLRADMSWRAFRGAAVPPEIAWITTHAHSIETFNTSVSHLRDQFLVGEEDRSLREAAHLTDREARAQKRRIAAVGGSDSHGEWLRATTFVLAKEKSREAIREAIAGARTCVRGPEACTLEVRTPGALAARWMGVGDEVDPNGGAIEARATGGDVTFVLNGSVAARAGSGEIVTLRVPEGRCSVLRAIVGRSWSSGVYVGCNLASPSDLFEAGLGAD